MVWRVHAGPPPLWSDADEGDEAALEARPLSCHPSKIVLKSAFSLMRTRPPLGARIPRGRHPRTEPVPAMAYRLVAKADAALEQKVLHIPQRQRKADVHHHQADHLRRRVEMAKRLGGVRGRGIQAPCPYILTTGAFDLLWTPKFPMRDRATNSGGLASNFTSAGSDPSRMLARNVRDRTPRSRCVPPGTIPARSRLTARP